MASRVRGNRDLIVHEKNGLLYPVKDRAALVQAIERLRNDADQTARLIGQARADVRKYSADTVDPMLLSLYAHFRKTL